MTAEDAPPSRWERTRVRADTRELRDLGAFLRDALDRPSEATPDLLMRVELVAAELFTNAVRHGAASRVSVGVGVRDDDVWLRIEDDGRPFDLAGTPAGPVGEPREGGYGLAIVRELAELVPRRYRDGINRVDAFVPFLREVEESAPSGAANRREPDRSAG